MGSDPAYQRLLQELLNHVDQAMAAEGIAPDVRDRVVTRVMRGTPTPAAQRSLRGPSINIGTTGIG